MYGRMVNPFQLNQLLACCMACRAHGSIVSHPLLSQLLLCPVSCPGPMLSQVVTVFSFVWLGLARLNSVTLGTAGLDRRPTYLSSSCPSALGGCSHPVLPLSSLSGATHSLSLCYACQDVLHCHA